VLGGDGVDEGAFVGFHLAVRVVGAREWIPGFLRNQKGGARKRNGGLLRLRHGRMLGPHGIYKCRTAGLVGCTVDGGQSVLMPGLSGGPRDRKS
jgi:hypothetical protein